MTGRGELSLVASVLLGFLLVFVGTDKFSAFTSEGARRLEVARNPRPLPDAQLEGHDGRLTTLDDFRGTVLLVDFIYTRCPTLCVTLGSSFERLRSAIDRAGLGGRIVLLSISFDPDNDGPAELTDYAARFGGTDQIWQFVRPRSETELVKLLKSAAVIVLPDDAGGFVHNAAIHVVDRQGKLVAIVDTEAVTEALALARRLL